MQTPSPHCCSLRAPTLKAVYCCSRAGDHVH
jgi:hypothetical protein